MFQGFSSGRLLDEFYPVRALPGAKEENLLDADQGLSLDRFQRDEIAVGEDKIPALAGNWIARKIVGPRDFGGNSGSRQKPRRAAADTGAAGHEVQG